MKSTMTNNTMVTVNSKSTKEEIKDFLNNNFKAVQKVDKDLADMITYTAKAFNKNAKAVSKMDLLDLAKEVGKVLPLPVEGAVKKAPVKKATPKAEPKKEVTKTEDKPKAKSSTKKADTSKKADKPEELFPKKYNHKEFGNLVAQPKATFEDVKKMVEEEKTVYLAMKWYGEEIKSYSSLYRVPVPVGDKFEKDIDLVSVAYAMGGIERLIGVSVYTEAVYLPDKEDFTPLEAEFSDGSTREVRVHDGIPFEVYVEA